LSFPVTTEPAPAETTSTDEQGETTMFNKTRIALSVTIVFSAASGAFAAPVREASNNSSQYSSPDSTPNGPFFNVDTYGKPPTVLRPVHQPRHSSRKH
jgi:hypothetical protein